MKKITWKKLLPIWWSFAWRATIYGGIGGFILGFIGGFLAAAMGHPEKAALYGMLSAYIISIPASMLALKQALSKHLLSIASIANHNPHQELL